MNSYCSVKSASPGRILERFLEGFWKNPGNGQKGPQKDSERALERSWKGLREFLERSWECLEIFLEMAWNLPETVLECPRKVVEKSWKGLRKFLEGFWKGLGRAQQGLELSWKVPGNVLKVPGLRNFLKQSCRDPGRALSCRPSCC